jgi:hypothetical protein
LLSSRAVPSARVARFYHARFPTLGKGDISTLSKRGHFYFGLTSGFKEDSCMYCLYRICIDLKALEW